MKAFEKTTIGGIEVKNRFVRSATAMSMASDDFYVTEKMIDAYSELAKGGVGLIIAEHASVLAEDTFEPNHIRIHDDKFIPGLKRLSESIHTHDSKVILQLGMSGTNTPLKPVSDLWGPSAVNDLHTSYMAKEMTVDEINYTIKAFGEAALRAKKAGFDGVQLHAAHGYFLNKFISPYYNRRDDNYGSNSENRSRIIIESLKEIKNVCGDDFPVFVKINISDFMKESGTLDFTEGKIIASILSKAGFNAIEISGGVAEGLYSPARNKIFKKEDEAYHKAYAVEVANNISTPVILVGGIRSLEVAEEILQNQNIEAVAISRPLIREPNLVKRWANGKTERALCRSCNACFNPNGAVCVFNKKRANIKLFYEVV